VEFSGVEWLGIGVSRWFNKFKRIVTGRLLFKFYLKIGRLKKPLGKKWLYLQAVKTNRIHGINSTEYF